MALTKGYAYLNKHESKSVGLFKYAQILSSPGTAEFKQEKLTP